MTISVLDQTIQVDSVGSITVTSATADEVAGGYVRDLIIFATPVEGETMPVVFTLRLRATVRANLDIDVPALTF